jgi:hypothetical protein
MVSQRDALTAEREEFYRRLRVAVGLVLIATGVLICLWAFASAYKVFTDPQKVEVFQTIVPRNPEFRTLDIDGEKVQLPLGLFNFMGYAIGCLLLFIAGSIGGGLISGGVKLLQPGFFRLEKRIKGEVDSLKATLEEMAERFKKEEKDK